MNKRFYKILSITILFIISDNKKSFTNNTKLYISTLSKLAEKKDFNTTLQNILSIINETEHEIIDSEKIKNFIESEDGKKLNVAFNNALNHTIFQTPLTTTGLFLYDFYQHNIFGPHTKIIGKAFEQYLSNLRNIPLTNSFYNIKTAKDFVKKHRILHKENSITNTLKTLQESIQLIKEATIEQLTDVNYLENILLPNLGFDGKKTHEFPTNLHPYSAKGLQSWQYPSQFAKLLVTLSQQKINTYLEIGTQHGGNFIIITEYLKKFNPEIKCYAIDPYYYLMLDLYVNEINSNAEYILDFANSKRFIDISNINWDVVSIDGDPSFEGTTQTYNLIKKNAHIIIINDIVNDLCPGVGSLWNILKKIYAKNSKVEEFTDQYEDIVQKQNKKYLGIGLICKNSKK